MLEPPYRENAALPEEPVDFEHLAISIMAKRTRRVRGITVVAAFAFGLFASACIYQFFWDYYEARGLMIPLKMIAVASLTMGLIPSLVLAPRVSSLFVRARRDAWLNGLAKKHGLDRAELEEMTRSFTG